MISAPSSIPHVVGAGTADLTEVDGEMRYGPFNPSYLPELPGVYMVFQGQECLYVGQSKNMRQRWQQHHRLWELQKMADSLTLTWVNVPERALHALEARLIQQLRPRLNRESWPVRARRAGTPIYLPIDEQVVAQVDRYAQRAQMPRVDAVHTILRETLDPIDLARDQEQAFLAHVNAAMARYQGDESCYVLMMLRGFSAEVGLARMRRRLERKEETLEDFY